MDIKNKLSRSNIPTILVIFGAIGNLATKKIIPLLWWLFSDKGSLSVLWQRSAFSRSQKQ